MVWPSTVAPVARITSCTPPVAGPAQQAGDVELLRADAVERRERAAQHVIAARDRSALRSSAQRSPTSSTTQMTAGSRRGSRQMAQGSSVSRLPQIGAGAGSLAAASASAVASGCIRVSRFFSRCSAARRAERGPRPGSRPSSWISRSMSAMHARIRHDGDQARSLRIVSMTARSERQLEAGGSCRPPVSLRHLRLATVGCSTLARASLAAATIRSSSTSISAGIGELGIDLHPAHLALAVEGDLDHAAAGLTRHLDALELGLHLRHAWLCISCACFIMLPRFFMLPRFAVLSLPAHVRPLPIRLGGCRLCRRPQFAHRLDRGAGKGRQHRLHQGMASAACARRLVAACGLLLQGRLARLARDGDDPAPAGPFRQQGAQPVGEIGRRLGLRPELDPAGLEMHEMHVVQQDGRAGSPRACASTRATTSAKLSGARLGSPARPGSGRRRARALVDGTAARPPPAPRAGVAAEARLPRRSGAGGAAGGGRRGAPAGRRRGGAAAAASSRRRTSSPGGGRSATWVRRISTISAACSGDGAACDFAQALQQHLPAARQRRHRELPGQRAAAPRSASGAPGSSAACGSELEPRQPMGELEQVLQHARPDRRPPDTCSARMAERARRIAPHQAARTGRTAGCGRPGPACRAPGPRRSRRLGPCGDRLVEQRQAVAHRAVGGARDQRQRARRDPRRPRPRRCRRNARPAPRHRRGAGRSAGSATARSPAPCGSRWWRR